MRNTELRTPRGLQAKSRTKVPQLNSFRLTRNAP